jgi:hypothetical protein
LYISTEKRKALDSNKSVTRSPEIWGVRFSVWPNPTSERPTSNSFGNTTSQNSSRFAPYYQEKGKPIQVLKKGDVVIAPANLEHWHGASPASKMVDIAITNFKGDDQQTWLQPVTDEEYNRVKMTVK